MYKSPIEITCNDYMKQYVEQFDNSVFMAIKKKFGANIDRVELIKALNYDRGQYEKGFEDGKKAAQPTCQKHGRWIPQDNRYVKFMCSVCGSKNYDGSGNYCPNCGAKMDGERKENETD